MEKVLATKSVSLLSKEAITHVASFYSLDKDDMMAELRVFTNLSKERGNESVLVSLHETISKRKQHFVDDTQYYRN